MSKPNHNLLLSWERETAIPGVIPRLNTIEGTFCAYEETHCNLLLVSRHWEVVRFPPLLDWETLVTLKWPPHTISLKMRIRNICCEADSTSVLELKLVSQPCRLELNDKHGPRVKRLLTDDRQHGSSRITAEAKPPTAWLSMNEVWHQSM